MTRTYQPLSLEIIYEVTNSTLTLGASLSLVAWGSREQESAISKPFGVTADVSRTHAGRIARCSRPGTTVRAEIAASLLRQKFAIFGGIATVQPAQPR